MGYPAPAMPAFLHAINKNAKDALINGGSVNLLNAAFGIEADPARPDDENAMKKNLRVDDVFSREIPWLNLELDAIRNLCDQFDEDFDRPAQTLLRATLLAKRYEIEEVKEWNTSRPLLALVTPMVGIWALGWTVRLEDPEKPEGLGERTNYYEPANMESRETNKDPAWTEESENLAMDRPAVIGRLSGAEHDDRIHSGKRPVFAYSEYLNDSAMDAETLKKVRDRIHRINGIMMKIVSGLTEE
jgi:hypothetical protein